MINADDLLFSYRWGADTLQKLVADVPDERFAEQPVEGINHPAWLIRHVANYNPVITCLLTGQSFANPWDEPCGKHSSPTSDRSAYPSKDEILAYFVDGYSVACDAIGGANAEAWTAPLDHPTWGKQFETVAPAVTFLATTHLALHVGQLSGWRRAAGLPRV